MGLRDRFFTPTTARAILSWRILVGLAVAAGTAVAGVSLPLAIALGVGVYAASVFAALPRQTAAPAIDPFTVGEPWRQLVQGSLSAQRKLRSTVDGVADGPLRERLTDIAAQLEHGVQQAWSVAKRGDEIDDTIRRLDPTALRSKLTSLEAHAAATPSPETDAAVESVRGQLATADRLAQQSAETASSLRLTQIRLDELVARASEVRIGAADTETYAHDVDDIVVQLEALRRAIEETRTA